MWKIWLRRILNTLFWLVLIAGVVIGWNMEDKDPESFFPGLFDGSKPAQTTPAPVQPAPPKAP